MIHLRHPARGKVKRIQREEGAYYWSGCVEGLLRKHGLIPASEPDGFGENRFIVATRGVTEQDLTGESGCFEGPLERSLARALGVATRERTAQSLVFRDAKRRVLGRLEYSTWSVRRIPRRRRERSLPYAFVSNDRLDRARHIRFQEIAASGSWEPLAYADVDGCESALVAVSDGTRIVLGLPVFDIVARAHTLSPLDAGYYAMTRSSSTAPIERWLIEEITAHAARAGIALLRIRRWPKGHSSALTVRHDYDRPVAPGSAAALLGLYDELGVKSSWGFLARMPERDLMRELAARGHEAALHTEAASETAFLKEVDAHASTAGRLPRGYTAHGGAGSIGHLGATQHRWAETAGLLYGELLGGGGGLLPHPLNDVVDGIPHLRRLVAPPTHSSFDLSTRPNEHQLDAFRTLVPSILAAEGHAVVMNHPDIHTAELETLLRELELSSTWCTTLEQVAHWSDVALFRSRASSRTGGYTIEFAQPLPYDADLVVAGKSPGDCPAGTRTLELSSRWASAA